LVALTQAVRVNNRTDGYGYPDSKLRRIASPSFESRRSSGESMEAISDTQSQNDLDRPPAADRSDRSTSEAEAPPKPQSSGRSSDAAEEKKEEQTRRRRRPTVLVVAILIGLLLVAGGIYYYLSGVGVQSTDDAYTDGRVINISPQVAGQVFALDVSDNEFVKAGQPIVHLDPRRYNIAREQAQGDLDAAKAQATSRQLAIDIAQKNFPALLEQAKAQLLNAQANLTRTKADYERQRSLPRAATTQQDVDASLAAYQQAQAQVMLAQAQVEESSPVPQRISTASADYQQQQGQVIQAQARLDQANLDLSHTVVRAPQDGWITRRNVEKGDYLTVGQQIVSIVSPQVWITANFKETQLSDMRPGDPVDITVDAYPNLKLRGHVDSIQLGTGSKFSAFPPENATGNFVKVVQRVPVKIVIDSGLDPKLPLPLGLSVDPTVKVQ
jgi:membrane fusion protein, multidrug efflux system